MGRKARARTSLAASHSSSVDKDESNVFVPDTSDSKIAALTETINRLAEQLAAEREARVRLEKQTERLVQSNLNVANSFQSGASQTIENSTDSRQGAAKPKTSDVDGGILGGNVNAEFHQPADGRSYMSPSATAAGNRKLHDLPVFSGLAEDWPMFEAALQQSTASFSYTEMENTFRLRKALSGQAREAVESLLIHADHVAEIMSVLKFRYGRPEQLVRSQIQKVSELPTISESRIEMIVPFATKVRNLVAFLDTDCTRQHLSNPQLLEDLMFKLPVSKRVEWAQVALNLKPYPTLHHFNDWLKRTADCISLVTKSIPTGTPPSSKSTSRNFKSMLHTSEQSTPPVRKCHQCNADTHKTFECAEFSSLPLPSRWAICKQNQWCFSCLQPGHQAAKCRRRKVCAINNCQRRHHQLLHDSGPQANSPAEAVIANAQKNLVLNCRNKYVEPTIMFRVLPVRLYGPFGAIDTLALLDEGSSVTLIDEQLADQLKLDGTSKKERLSLQWYGEKCESEMSRRVALRISGVESGQTIYSIDNVRTVKTLKLPSQSVSLSTLCHRYPVLKELPLKEIEDKPPRIMIGLQHAHLGSAIRTVECSNGPIAVYTKLGWVVHGPCSAVDEANKPVVLMCQEKSEWQRIDKIVEDYFSTENLGVKSLAKPIEYEADKRARALLSETTVRVADRFEAGLLWKKPLLPFPDSREMAMKRLESVERKMERDPEYGAAYRNIINDYLRKGYARKLSKQEEKVSGDRTWYLPHFGVRNVNKPAKIRLVFDAAATVNGVSLNSQLLTGPDLNQPLLGVLFRFRAGVVGVLGDIEEMFHQVRIARKDQDSQRFFWRHGDSSRPVETYVMGVMIFGAACSPCSAQYVKNINADELGKDDPEAVKAIRKQHYVDDYVSSFATVDEAIRTTQSVIQIHRQGGFNLRNFVSNEPNLLKAVGDSAKSVEKRLVGDVETDKVLGIRWSTSNDSFTFKLTFARVNAAVIAKTRRPTKREVLSVAMSVFDPFGMVANFSIYAKVQIQELWRLGLEWDDSLPDDQYKKWLCWMEELKRCTNTSVPRCYSRFFISSPERQLHIFVDASETAYAAAAYWRVKRPDENYDVAFIMGKTKCAPRKLLSMPRLELQAAVLGCRLYNNIMTLHEVRVSSVIFWTDSKTVAQWIKADPRRYKPFVANRIAEILETSSEREWRWIPSEHNVADDATRAEYPPKIETNGRWLSGPAFLRLPDPISFETPKDEASHGQEELRPKYVYLTQHGSGQVIDFSRFSNYRRLKRTVAWVLRFVAATRSKRLSRIRKKGELSAEELAEADLQICRLIQADEFTCELALLRNDKPIEKSSSIYKLSPQIDTSGTIRMFGRTDAAAYISADTRRPILLPKRHYVTELIVRYYHDLLKHQNLEAIVCAVRKRYWVPNLRALARRVQSTCQFCRIRTANPKPPKMGQHPIDRLTPYIRPFTYTGLDYFGPLLVTIGRRREKRWVALFTCLTTRAVHLEIAADLSTDACLLCIRNLINIRGLPARIRSDNGTNFVGAAKEIGRLSAMFDTSAIQQDLSGRGIEWIFNSPANPEAGGCWERMVQSIKRVLAVTLKEVAPQVETLRSLLLEAANIVNNRPLTHVPVDPVSDEPLTPNHFLLGSTNLTESPDTPDLKSICLGKQWRILQQLKGRFWTRWVNEYLPELTRRTKWHEDAIQLKCGDLVLICDTNLSRGQWRRGRVVEVFPGPDGIVRQAVVRTIDGLVKRPTSRLAVLDVSGKH